MKWLNELGAAAKCFFDWPNLHTRIMVYMYLIFSGFQLDHIRGVNSDTNLSNMLAQGYQWGALAIIAFYITPKLFDTVATALVNWRTGSPPQPLQATKTETETNTKVTTTAVNPVPPS